MNAITLTDKQRRLALRTCLQEFRNTLPSSVEEYCNNNCDMIFAFMESSPTAKSEVAAYGARMKALFEFVSTLVDEITANPMEGASEDECGDFVAAIDRLRSDVKSGIIELARCDEAGKRMEWGGTGVIITSERNSDRTADIVVHTKHAGLISWLMLRLRDMGSHCIDFQNKREFYGEIARSAQNYIEAHGDTDTSLAGLAIQLLDTASLLVKSWSRGNGESE